MSTCLIELKLHVVSFSSIPHGYIFIHPHKSSKSARFPDLYFSGTFIGINRTRAIVNGSVNMGDDGTVRCQFVSHTPCFMHLACTDVRLFRHLCMTATLNGALRVYKWVMLEVPPESSAVGLEPLMTMVNIHCRCYKLCNQVMNTSTFAGNPIGENLTVFFISLGSC